jgi:gliding motility-associatede transport system auxiliary component
MSKPASPAAATAPGPSHRGLLSIGGIILVFVLFVAINIVSNRTLNSAQIDLTADKLYTLSPGTKAVLAKIGEPITVRFYFSDALGREIPSYAVYANRIRELLRQYRAAANGKLKLEMIDPAPFSDDEDRAVAFGLQGVPVSQGGDLVYFGLAGSNSADKDEIIAFFQPERERFLEYDITKLVYNLTVTKKPSVGLLSTLPIQGDFQMGRPSQPWAVYSQMSQFFDVKTLDKDAAAIPDDIKVLVLVHPQNLPEKTQYAIDQFVLRGGHALVFVDPNAEGQMLRPGVAQQTGLTSSNPKKLFDAWGIEMVPDKVAGDRVAARRVNAGDASRVRAVDYIAWLTLRPNNFNTSDILTGNLSVIQMASAGILKAKEGATTKLEPLIETSPQSEQIDADKTKMQPDPVALLAQFKPSNERYILAARVSGPAKTAFPDGPPPEEKKDEKKDDASAGNAATPTAATPPAERLTEAKQPINVIVIADTDMLEDRFWAQTQDFFGQTIVVPTASNGDFIVNAIDNLMGSDELISLRTRGQSARPFTLVQAIQQDAELQFREKERQLTDQLKETEKKLSDLQGQGGAGGGTDQAGKVILSKEQQEAIEQFRGQVVQIRRQLRDVQHELRRNIEDLGLVLKFVNIWLVPILVGIAAIVVGVLRVRRRAPSRRVQTGDVT